MSSVSLKDAPTTLAANLKVAGIEVDLLQSQFANDFVFYIGFLGLFVWLTLLILTKPLDKGILPVKEGRVSLCEAIAYAGTGKWGQMPSEIKNPVSIVKMAIAVRRTEKLANSGILRIFAIKPLPKWVKTHGVINKNHLQGDQVYLSFKLIRNNLSQTNHDIPLTELDVDAVEFARSFSSR